MKKLIRWPTIIVFFVFYITAIIVSNFPYPEYASTPAFVNIGINILTILSFLFMTFMFSGSKKFFITVTAYFAVIILSFIVLMSLGGVQTGTLLTFILFVSYLTFWLPTIHLDISDATDKVFIDNIISLFIILVFTVIAFYVVYFVGKRIKSKNQNNE